MSAEYESLVAKVDAFCQDAETRAADALACERGCSACCHVWLDVSAVEARAVERFLGQLPESERAAVAERGEQQAARRDADETPARCPMLDDDESCAIYPARPLICRSQGLALRYPAGTVPAPSVRFRTDDDGDVVACPLNYTEREPHGSEVLNAHQVDTLLALVNHRHAEVTGDSATERVSLLDLARGKG